MDSQTRQRSPKSAERQGDHPGLFSGRGNIRLIIHAGKSWRTPSEQCADGDVTFMKSLIALSVVLAVSTAGFADIEPIRMAPTRPAAPVLTPAAAPQHATAPAATHTHAGKKKHSKKHAPKHHKAP